jgi:hypothetical protein
VVIAAPSSLGQPRKTGGWGVALPGQLPYDNRMRTSSTLGLLLLATVFLSACHREEKFGLIQVSDLTALLSQTAKPVYVFDANETDFRQKNGIIPGAKLLSSFDKYDVKKELPGSKAATLVFYCSNKL